MSDYIIRKNELLYNEPDWETYFVKYYDTFDKSHNRTHAIEVSLFADKLAIKYAPNYRILVRAAALLHDIGLSIDRENHEIHGKNIVLSDNILKEFYTKKEIKLIANAIGEHRASNGKPSSIISKIISDSDRISTKNPIRRSWLYHMQITNNEEQSCIDARNHILHKYGINGKGRRVYFPETKFELKIKYDPIIKILEYNDIKKIKSLIYKE